MVHNGRIAEVSKLRQDYLKRIKGEILYPKTSRYGETINIADVGNQSSCLIAKKWADLLPGNLGNENACQSTGTSFEDITKDFLEKAFSLLIDLRPGLWGWARHSPVDQYDQYYHLKLVEEFLDNNPHLKATLGEDYIINPDIVVYREPINPEDLGGRVEKTAVYTPLLYGAVRGGQNILHASISCKLTLRSDRAQNARTEALNLIRNRKGRTPHIVVVTAEPHPNRIASIALGTGDIDCVYHAGLHELVEAVSEVGTADANQMLNMMIEGRRLRDISDLPFDLAI